MKKVVRMVWISALSGLAFLSACCTQNGLTRKERKKLVAEREHVEMELASFQMGEIRSYYYIEEYLEACNKKYSLENKLDSINFRLGEAVDFDRNARRHEILHRIDSLNYLMETYIPPCIYGPPEMLEQYEYEVESEYDGYEKALKAAQKELDELDNIETDVPEIHELLYGGPNVIMRPVKQEVIQKDPSQD